MKKEIVVAGMPSIYGGAGAELLGQAIAWSECGVPFRFVTLSEPIQRDIDICSQMGWSWKRYEPRDLDKQIVAAWNSGTFLALLTNPSAHGTPRRSVWFSCMTITTPIEEHLLNQRVINRVGYVSHYQRSIIGKKAAGVREFDGYRMFFESRPGRPFAITGKGHHEMDERGSFVIGRVSRDDPMKYPVDFWHTVTKMLDSIPGSKFRVMGYGPQCRAGVGDPDDPRIEILHSMQEPLQTFLSSLDCFWYEPGPANESFGRVVVEAMLSQCACVVPDGYAFREMCFEAGVPALKFYSSRRELFEAVAQLAGSLSERRMLSTEARRVAVSKYGNAERSCRPWMKLLEKR